MPRVARKEPRTRLNLELTQTVRDRIERLRILTEADSTTEVFRRALSAYDRLIKHVGAGGAVILRDASGKERELVFPWADFTAP